jgi:hypothetical protein
MFKQARYRLLAQACPSTPSEALLCIAFLTFRELRHMSILVIDCHAVILGLCVFSRKSNIIGRVDTFGTPVTAGRIQDPLTGSPFYIEHTNDS